MGLGSASIYTSTIIIIINYNAHYGTIIKYRLRATHVAIIKNMKQDVLTWRSLSTAEYRVHPVVLLHILRVLLANDFCGSFRT